MNITEYIKKNLKGLLFRHHRREVGLVGLRNLGQDFLRPTNGLRTAVFALELLKTQKIT